MRANNAIDGMAFKQWRTGRLGNTRARQRFLCTHSRRQLLAKDAIAASRVAA
jgi:hypothetical protein